MWNGRIENLASMLLNVVGEMGKDWLGIMTYDATYVLLGIERPLKEFYVLNVTCRTAAHGHIFQRKLESQRLGMQYLSKEINSKDVLLHELCENC